MTLRPTMAAFALLLAAGVGAALAQAPSSSAPPNPFAGMVRFGGTVASASGNSFVVHPSKAT